jgi:hypothetical protein
VVSPPAALPVPAPPRAREQQRRDPIDGGVPRDRLWIVKGRPLTGRKNIPPRRSLLRGKRRSALKPRCFCVLLFQSSPRVDTGV